MRTHEKRLAFHRQTHSFPERSSLQRVIRDILTLQVQVDSERHLESSDRRMSLGSTDLGRHKAKARRPSGKLSPRRAALRTFKLYTNLMITGYAIGIEKASSADL